MDKSFHQPIEKTCISGQPENQTQNSNQFNPAHYKNKLMKKNFKPLTPYPVIGTPIEPSTLLSVQDTIRIDLVGLGQ